MKTFHIWCDEQNYGIKYYWTNPSNNSIKNINTLSISIFSTYYDNPETTNFYKQALNYTYIQTPYEYININNSANTNL